VVSKCSIGFENYPGFFMSDRSEGVRSVGETRRCSAFWTGGILEKYVEDQNAGFKRRNQEMAPAADCLMKYSGREGEEA
jgi:hypothetical protein